MAVLPVFTGPGRNDPCPCGSGKKYKHCHLRRGPDEHALAHRVAQRVVAELRDFGLDHLEELSRAWQAWAQPDQPQPDGPPPDRPPPAQLLPDEPPPALEGPQGEAFLDYFLHDHRSGQGTMAERFLAQARHLSPAARRWLEDWMESTHGAWQTLEIQRHRGVRVRNVFTGEERFVHDRTFSRNTVPGAVMIGRVIRCAGRFELLGAVTFLPARQLPRLREDVRRAFLDYRADLPGASWEDFFRAEPLLFRRQRGGQGRLRFTNTQGHEIVLGTARYAVRDAAGALRALGASARFQQEAEGQFRWLEPELGVHGTQHPVSLGQVFVEDGQLRLEANSRERLEAGKELLRRELGWTVHHLEDTFEDLPEQRLGGSDVRLVYDIGVVRDLPGIPPPGEGPIPPEVERAVEEKLLNDYYEGWMHRPIPSLGDRSPLAASITARGRRQLEALLEDHAWHAGQAEQRGKYAYPTQRLRARLGLDEACQEPRFHPAWLLDVPEEAIALEGEPAGVRRATETLVEALLDEEAEGVEMLLLPGGRAAILYELYGTTPLVALLGLHQLPGEMEVAAALFERGRGGVELRVAPQGLGPPSLASTLVWERADGGWRLDHVLPVPLLDEGYEMDPLTEEVFFDQVDFPLGAEEALDPVERLLATEGLLPTIYDLVHAVRLWRNLKRRGLPGGSLFRRFGLDAADDPEGWAAALGQVIVWLGAGDPALLEPSEPSSRTVRIRCRYIIRRLRLGPGDGRYSLNRTDLSDELLRIRPPA